MKTVYVIQWKGLAATWYAGTGKGGYTNALSHASRFTTPGAAATFLADIKDEFVRLNAVIKDIEVEQ